MSLLIKALEQAAKDRDSAKSEPGTAAAKGPAREPMSTSEAAARSASTLSLETPAQRRPAASLSGLANIEAQQRARAAAVVQAGERAGGKLVSYLRANPVAMFGAIAALVAIGFGVYVYLQIANPAMFTRPPPRPPDTVVQAPPPLPPAPPVVVSTSPVPDASGTAAVPAPPPTASPTDTRLSASGVAAAGAIPGTAAGSSSSTGPTPGPAAASGPAGMSGPISTASVVGTSNLPDRSPPAARGSEAPREAQARSTPQPEKHAIAAIVDAPRERIVVSASTPKPTLNPSLTLAYSAMQTGDVEQARALYTRIIQTEPLNIDALLGLAYLAAQDNRNEDAMKHYLRILQLEPRHALAQAATISLMGRADPTAAEARLKQLIAREPSAFLHFVLGNLYADQSSWAQAQQAYFQAYHLEPDNPDYAYNLAVALDHLRQSKLALDFYRRAEQLAVARGRSNFNVSNARDRIASLSSQLQ